MNDVKWISLALRLPQPFVLVLTGLRTGLNIFICPMQDLLAKQLWTVVTQALSAARSNPTQLVTALRIVEREER